ncbi:MAG TPA: hypothetical protein VN445_11805 [Rectinemataceae bacterium]|nr:hypothetical protein [Rectinemataceae bacterium]
MAPERKRSQFHLLRFAVVMTSLLVASCSLFEKKPAVLWTDTPEMLIAAEMFNASQNRHLIEVHYVEELAVALRLPAADSRAEPSIVVGRGLRTKTLDNYFLSLEYLFGELVLSKSSFYPALLEGGEENNRQTLVPVSFNLLLVLSGKEAGQRNDLADLDLPQADSSVITMEEIQRHAALFNSSSADAARRIGFSPRWPDRDFMFQWIQLGGAAFSESRSKRDRKSSSGESLPVSWDPTGIQGGVAKLCDYIRTVNGSVAEEDAYAFKYLYAPGYKDVEEGKLLYTAMNSADYFTLTPVLRSKYNYHYFSERGKLAISEDIKYAGIPRRAPNKESAEQFLRWFFNAENQKAILEKSRALRLSESAFGIAGGFSSIQSVTETLFPSYYTELLGRTAPKAMVLPPEPFPPSWNKLKTEFILPWLDETAGKEPGSPVDAEFASSLEAYLDKNPDLRSGDLRSGGLR